MTLPYNVFYTEDDIINPCGEIEIGMGFAWIRKLRDNSYIWQGKKVGILELKRRLVKRGMSETDLFHESEYIRKLTKRAFFSYE